MKTWLKDNGPAFLIFLGIICLSLLLISLSSCDRPTKDNGVIVQCVVDSIWTIGPDENNVKFIRTQCGQTVMMDGMGNYKIGDTLIYVYKGN